MPHLSRRRFLSRSTAAVAAGCLSSTLAELRAAPLGLPIGTQTYPFRDQIAEDFPGTLKKLTEWGYQAIEMCSPPGYSRSGFGALADKKPSEIRAIIEDCGLECESCHFQFRELTDNLTATIDYAKELGLEHMVIAAFSLPREGATLDDWKAAAEKSNKIGAEVKKAGLQLGFHNHHMEFKEINGTLIYDELLKTFDPELVKLQFQVAVIDLGYKAADYFTKYPGRYISIHLQDVVPGQGQPVPIGKGMVDWKELFRAAKIGGVKNYFVEVNPEAAKASYPFLRDLEV